MRQSQRGWGRILRAGASAGEIVVGTVGVGVWEGKEVGMGATSWGQTEHQSGEVLSDCRSSSGTVACCRGWGSSETRGWQEMKGWIQQRARGRTVHRPQRPHIVSRIQQRVALRENRQSIWCKESKTVKWTPDAKSWKVDLGLKWRLRKAEPPGAYKGPRVGHKAWGGKLA